MGINVNIQVSSASRQRSSQNTYSQYETGTIALSAETAVKLAKYYGVSVDYLLGVTNEKKPYPAK